MKRLVCEMCGGTDLVKQEGVFVCQSCGTKYSVEEAKKMMVEVEGKVDVSGSTVKVDSSQKLNNLLLLAKRARDENNSEEAKKYYEMALMEDPSNWEPTFYSQYYKLKETTIGNLPENLRQFSNRALTTLDMLIEEGNDVKEKIQDMVLSSAKVCAEICVYVNKTWAEERNKFMASSLEGLLKNVSSPKSTNPYTKYLEESSQRNSTSRFKSATNTLFSVTESMRTFLMEMYSKSNRNTDLVGEDTVLNVARLCDQVFAVDVKNVVEMSNYSSYTSDMVRFECTVQEDHPNFTSTAIPALKDHAKSCVDSGSTNKLFSSVLGILSTEPGRIKAEKENRKKKLAFKAYWEAHAEEKDQLLQQKQQLTEERKPHATKAKELRDIIKSIKERKVTAPAEEEYQKMQVDIRNLRSKRDGLGMFKGKEKKQLTDEIDAIEKKLPSIRELAEKQKGELNEKNKEEAAKYEEEWKFVSEKLKAYDDQISAIDVELTKDR